MTITNVMRLLNVAGIKYDTAEYDVDESDLSGVHAAEALGFEVESVFKTLVASGDKNGLNVFVIPVAEELDLKKCASVSGNKKVEMIKVSQLLPLTGYIRGGCSPIGMKKRLPTYIDETAQLSDKISISAGQRGVQVLICADDLKNYIGAQYADLIKT
ncbi:MAG: Cys-tRNA(Pro) deacylase [Clostridia bacterium]|nr:Cys-tRNA(Pro) deacylase [Clostridia bacterium]